MAKISISLNGIRQAVTNLNYRPSSVKYKAVAAIESFYTSEDSIQEIRSIDTDVLVGMIWDIREDPGKIRSKRRNFFSLKSSINADLKKLSKKDLNPENIIISGSNVFDMTEEAKNNLLSSFTDAVKTGDIDLEQATGILKAVSDFLDAFDMDDGDKESLDIIQEIKKILSRISQSDLIDEEDLDEAIVEIEDDEELEVLEEEEDDIEEIELDEDEEILEEEDDEELEVLEDEDDVEEIELDEDEELEELEDLDEDIEELDEDEELEEIDEEDEPEEIELDEDEELEEIEDLDEDIEELELDEDEELEEIDEEDEPEEIELDEDEELEEIEDLDEDVEELELDEDEEIEEIDEEDEPEEIELDEDEELEEIEDLDEDIEELELDEDEELEEVDELDEEELKALEEFREQRELAEQFDDALGEREKKFNAYVKVPQGLYTVGTRKGLKASLELQQIEMPKTYIGRYPVTNALFEIFIDNTGYVTTAETKGFGVVFSSRYKKGKTGSSWQKTAGSQEIKGACWFRPSGPESSLHGKRNHPVVQVSVEDALAYASWIGRRIPTEAEWEAAARTDLGNRYPWGNDFNPLFLNHEQSALADTCPVDEYEDHANEFTITDMLGNVMEWTSDEQDAPFKTRVNSRYSIAKGGAWNSGPDITIGSRGLYKIGFTSNTIGFRCISEIFQ